MNDVYICKIPLENIPGEFVPVYSTWADTRFSLNIFHGGKAWDKSVSESDLKSLCAFTHKSIEEYLLETKRALTCEGGCEDFTYSLIKSEFIWKKIVDSGRNIKVKFGSLLLEEMPVSSFTEKAVDFLLNNCVTLKMKNKYLMKENDDLRTANTSLRTHVCGITKLKTEMEDALYSKSLAILNTKKEKIRELEQIIEARPTASEPTLDSGHKERKEGAAVAATSNNLSDIYGSETEIDTDENSDNEFPIKSSILSSNAGTRVKEEVKESLPTAAKSQKLDYISSSIKSENLMKNQTENEDDDVADIFVPARRRKNTKTGVLR